MACSRAPVTLAGKVSVREEQPSIDAAHKTHIAKVPTFICTPPGGHGGNRRRLQSRRRARAKPPNESEQHRSLSSLVPCVHDGYRGLTSGVASAADRLFALLACRRDARRYVAGRQERADSRRCRAARRRASWSAGTS